MYPFTKRVLDIVLSLLAIILLAPLFILLPILICIDSKGPVFYISPRVGQYRKIFKCLKFRTMTKGADRDLLKYKHMNQYDSAFVKIEGDPRVTRIGKFLRKTSLDELPQFFNVLFGDMSIVGNRPLPVYEAESISNKYDARFEAEAGITGLWQVMQRGSKSNMSADKRLYMDVDYAQNRTIQQDLYLMLRTVPAMLQKSNA